VTSSSLQDVLTRIAQLTSIPVQQPATTATSTSTSFAAALSQAAAPQTSGSGSTAASYAPAIDAAANRNGIDPLLLQSLIQQESGFDPNATSSSGAQGLTQLMPSTAAGLGVTNPYDPAQSIEGGAKYLADQLSTFKGNVPLALAAYNAGPGAVEQAGGVPPYPETTAYVQQVLARYDQLKAGAS
jgi:soluble lytic murein transglycosylase-like protein